MYKIKTDGTAKTKIKDGFENQIHIIGDWIYYFDDDGKLFKMKTDGTGTTEIN